MRSSVSVAVLLSGALVLAFAEGDAHALAVPDFGTCDSHGYGCLRLTNNNTAGSSVAKAVVGYAFNGGIGVEGESDVSYGFGVHGISSNGIAVGGESASNGTGVYASSYTGSGLVATSLGGPGVTVSSNNNDSIVSVTYSTFKSGLFAQNLASGGGGFGVYGAVSGNGQAIHGENQNAAGWAGYFNGKVYASAGFTSSDARLKKEIADLSYGLKELSTLRPVTFKWKDQIRGEGRQVGLIAQELQKVVPEVVDKDGTTGMYSVNYPGLVPVLIKAVQEQQKIVQDQQRVIERQDARIARLERGPIMSSLLSGSGDMAMMTGFLGAIAVMIFRRRRERGSLTRPSRP